jgi:hypothetical protein
MANRSRLLPLDNLASRLESTIGGAGEWHRCEWPLQFGPDFRESEGIWDSKVYVEVNLFDLGRAHYIRVNVKGAGPARRVRWSRESFTAYGDWPNYHGRFLP